MTLAVERDVKTPTLTFVLAIPFVSSPCDDIDLLHEQYMSGLSGLLDIHAPVKTKQLIKPAPS